MEASSRCWWTGLKSCQFLSLLPVSAPLFCDMSMMCPGLHFVRAGWGVLSLGYVLCFSGHQEDRHPSALCVLSLTVSVISVLDLKDVDTIGLWQGSPVI